MAYTFSHPAAILPLRKYLPFSALIVGSMAPDYLYFIPGIPHSHYGHSTQGTFTFSLPASLLVLWLFHRVLKKPLMRLLPDSHQQRLVAFQAPFRFGGPRRFFLLVLTVLLAIETHIWWDAATHYQGFFPRHFPVLRAAIDPGSQFMWCDLLQSSSSVIGALALFVAYWHWFRQAPVAAVDPYYRITGTRKTIVLLAMAAIAVAVAVLVPSPVIRPGVYFALAGEALDLTRALLIQAILLALIWMPRKRVVPVAESTTAPT